MYALRRGLCGLVLAVVAVTTAAGADATVPSPLTALVDAAAVGLQTADPVAAFKWLAKGSIEDPARVGQVLAALSADAVAADIDPDYIRPGLHRPDQRHRGRRVRPLLGMEARYGGRPNDREGPVRIPVDDRRPRSHDGRRDRVPLGVAAVSGLRR